MEYQDQSRLPQKEQPPILLKQRYEIEKKIGEGGFAETFLAYDRHARQKCVLKMLSWKEAPDWKVIELFEREARVLSQLDHPQIPHFIEFFTERVGQETQIVLVQEYIAGKNLAQFIQEGKHHTEKEVIEIALKFARILEYLQSFSPAIIHRDIKPSNLMLSEDGELHLIDFGAVRDKVLHYQKTEAGGFTVVGTYGFMPFEQFQGQAVPASDIYSLGMTLITLLSHKEPHELETVGSTLDFEPYVNVSTGFRAVLKKMIEHRVEDRYLNATELRKDLESLFDGRQPVAVRSKWKLPISSGTIVTIGLALAIALFAVFKEPSVAPPPPQKVTQVTQQKSALAGPFTGRIVRGQIFFDGVPVTKATQVQPYFWFRDETTGKLVTAKVSYENGEFVVEGLPPGQYGIHTSFDANQLNPAQYPNDLRAWNQFSVVKETDTAMQVHLQKVIHLVKPENNNLVLRDWNRCCESGKPSHRGPIVLEWRSVGENVQYDYSVSRVACPYKWIGSVASGTTEQNRVILDLPSNAPKEYYILQLHARKNGKMIGMLMTHGANGHGWDYRFQVD